MSRDVIINTIENCITDLEPSTEQEAIQALASCIMSVYSYTVNQSPYCVHPEKIHSGECENMGCLLCKNKFVAELQNKLENKLKQIKGEVPMPEVLNLSTETLIDELMLKQLSHTDSKCRACKFGSDDDCYTRTQHNTLIMVHGVVLSCSQFKPK